VLLLALFMLTSLVLVLMSARWKIMKDI